jgi:hypothetical protein
MKNSTLLLLPIVIAFIFQACGSANDSVIIAGQVVESGSGNPISQAVVEITQPANLQQTATTDSAGNFSFDVEPGDETVNTTIEISKQGYSTNSSNFKLTPDTDIDDLIIRLQSSDTDDGGDGEDDDVVGGESGGPASLELTSISSSSIALRGTGGDEESKFTFAVKDSAGRPVAQGYEVNFSIIRGPDGGERINPSTGVTSSEGIVSSSIASGDSAGVVKVEASINRPNVGVSIQSTPVLVSIGNGFPQSENFRVAPVNTNFEAWGLIASSESTVEPNVIVASLGDYRNNPVLPGTAVDFTTTAGIITASAVTDENGLALAEIRPDGSTPADNPRGVGFATVTARTVDTDDNYITAETDLLFTSRNPSISLSPTPFSIPSNGSESFDLTITDVNGYPIAAGSTISVSVGEGLSSTFEEITLGDYVSAGEGKTEFGFTVSDTDDENSNEVNTSISVTVTLPSGQTKSVDFSGTRAKMN